MEDQIPQSQTFQAPPQMPPGFTQEQVEQMKARAKEAAIRMAMEQRPQLVAPPQYVYVRRNLTVAELIVVLLIACGIVTGVQVGWNFVSKNLPRIEIKVK
jgi:hypothetical protein